MQKQKKHVSSPYEDTFFGSIFLGRVPAAVRSKTQNKKNGDSSPLWMHVSQRHISRQSTGPCALEEQNIYSSPMHEHLKDSVNRGGLGEAHLDKTSIIPSGIPMGNPMGIPMTNAVGIPMAIPMAYKMRIPMGNLSKHGSGKRV